MPADAISANPTMMIRFIWSSRSTCSGGGGIGKHRFHGCFGALAVLIAGATARTDCTDDVIADEDRKATRFRKVTFPFRGAIGFRVHTLEEVCGCPAPMRGGDRFQLRAFQAIGRCPIRALK